ncbi:MAG TPA: DUF551 domain-containing protein [Anaerolineae bacterium]|nr:DUF551 domain-containing protein [Anaerolineae bacterium]
MSYEQNVTVYSVEERLPKAPGSVFGWVGYRWERVYVGEDGRFRFEGTALMSTVTHWHELPGPPRESERLSEACTPPSSNKIFRAFFQRANGTVYTMLLNPPGSLADVARTVASEELAEGVTFLKLETP